MRVVILALLLVGCTSNAPTRAKQCGYLQPDGTLVTYYCPMPTKYGNT